MGQDHTEVSLVDIGKSALSMVSDLPEIGLRLWGLATVTPESKRSMGLFFQDQAKKNEHGLFLKDGDNSWTYGQFNRLANQTARALAEVGIKRGDTVGILSENRYEVLATVIACAKLGAISALLNFNQRGEVQAHSIELVQPKLLLVGRLGVEVLQELNDASNAKSTSLPVMAFDEPEQTSLRVEFLGSLLQRQSENDFEQVADIQAKEPLFYIFTSGTTGMPKASIMSHYRWLQAMNGMGAAVRLRQSDVFYCCLPLYHNNALTVSLGVCLAAGACFALDKKFSASRFWDRIRHYQATSFCYIGELLRYLVNRPASLDDQNHEVRLITGNGLRPEIWKKFEDRFGIDQIFEFYGASESNLGFMNAFGLRETVGFTPIPYKIIQVDPETELPVRNRKGHCMTVGRGDVGLLISEVTKRRPFDGYTDPKANEKKLLKGVFKKNDVWFNSGDLVRDQGWGHIQFVDRLGDTFRWKGENVATSEVEGVLSQLDWIDQVAVYGVKMPNADGRAGMAAVCLKERAPFDSESISALVREKLPSYARPLFVRVMAGFQTTGTHKIQKAQLKKEGYEITDSSDPVYEWDSKRNLYSLRDKPHME